MKMNGGWNAREREKSEGEKEEKGTGSGGVGGAISTEREAKK